MTALTVHPDDSEELLELELADVCSLWTRSTIAQNQTAISRLWLAYRGGEILASDGLGKGSGGPGRTAKLAVHFPDLSGDAREHLSRRWQRIYRFGQSALKDYQASAEEPTVSGALKEIARKQKEAQREAKRQANRELVSNVPALELAVPDPQPTLMLDPPWDWGDEGDVDQLGRATPTYATIPFEKLLELPVAEVTQPNAHLYLWITNRSLPKGFELLETWGFRYITILTWAKPHYGMGNYFRGQTEHVLFGVRGSLPLLRNDVGTWLAANKVTGNLHSAKPNEFYELVETCSPGPWIEGFSRRKRNGWITWGEVSAPSS